MFFKKAGPKLPAIDPGVAMGGQPALKDMAKSSFNPRLAKAGYFVGLSCFLPFGKAMEKTAKNVPAKEKLEQDWRGYDMPEPTTAKHLKDYLDIAEPRTLERAQRAQAPAPERAEATPDAQATEAFQQWQVLQESRALAQERIVQQQAALEQQHQRAVQGEQVLAQSSAQLTHLGVSLKYVYRQVAANQPARKAAERHYGNSLLQTRGEAVDLATQALARLFPQPAARASLAEAFQQAVPEARGTLDADASIKGEALLRAIVIASQRAAVDQPDGPALGALLDVLQQQPASSRAGLTDAAERSEALQMLSRADQQLGALRSLEQQLARSVAPGPQAGQPIELTAAAGHPRLARLQTQANKIIALSPAPAHRLEAQIEATRAQQEAEVVVQRFRNASVRQAKQALQRETQALAPLDAQLAASRSRYEGLRTAAVTDAIERFFGAYTDLKGLDDDRARAKATERILPEFARALELPADYLQASQKEQRALALADALSSKRTQKLDQLSSVLEVMAGQAGGADAGPELQALRDALSAARTELPTFVDEGKARLKQHLSGQVAREILADRASTLPGKPPTAEEAQAWSDQAGQLKALTLRFAKQAEDIEAALPAATERVKAQQAASMNELVKHLPGALDAPVALRERIADHLQRIAGHQIANSQPTKDAPLAPMQLVHVVQLATQAAEGSPVRMERLLGQLANQSVADVLRAHTLPGGPPGTDEAQMWRLAAHETPEVVSSLLAANAPANKGVDWRDVQSFWRAAQEHGRLGAKPEERAHKQRLDAAMEGLAMEVGGEPTARGSLQQRYANMVRAAVWKLDTYNAVNKHLEALCRPGVIVSQDQAEIVRNLNEAKGRGHPAAEARQHVASAIEQLRQVAATRTEGSSQSATHRLATGCMMEAVADYLTNRRGSESAWQGLKRRATRSVQTFQSGKEVWSNELRPRDKMRIQASYRERFAQASGQSPDQAPTLAAFSRVSNLQTRDNALDLLQEAVVAGAELSGKPAAQALTDAGFDAIQAKVALLQGGAVDSPAALKRFLHDVIDRAELGDRMDTMAGKVFRFMLAARAPFGIASVNAAAGGYNAEAAVLDIEFNNNAGLLRIGNSKERNRVGALGGVLSLDGGVAGLLGPGAAVRLASKTREDPAVVLNCEIVPVNGLRDLAEASRQLNSVVAAVVDYPQLRDAGGQPYTAPYEALLDRVHPQPTIDVEHRRYQSTSKEVAAQVGLKLAPATDHVGIGAGVTIESGKTRSIMRSENQQGATELYDTSKYNFGAGLFAGLTTKHVGHEKAYAPTGVNASAFVAGLWTGAEEKRKNPVGADRLKAYKHEFGRYDRNVKEMIGAVTGALPQVARRVQDVCKGFPGLDEKDRVRMEVEIFLDFYRALKHDVADRFSAKLESGQQWMNRGLDGATSLAEKSGDHEMAAALTQVHDKLTEGHMDQAVKYFVAVGELMESRTTFSGKKASASSWREDPIPDTRTATLVPVAERVERLQERPALPGWAERIKSQTKPDREGGDRSH